MGPSPLPPHERAWRHPSELAPTTADVDVSTRGGGRTLVFATGLTAAMMAAVIVIALTPPKSDAPTAVSATTLPALTVQLRSESVQTVDRETMVREPETVRINRNSMSRDHALALVGSPNAVSAAPSDPETLDVAEQLPDDAARMYVLTTSHAYKVHWSQIDRIIAPDGSVVITADGALVATFVDGELRVLVEV